MKRTCLIFLLSIFFIALNVTIAFSQVINPQDGRSSEIDSLRKKEENKKDSLIITSKYIRYTTESILKDSTRTLPIDTTLRGFHNYNVLYQPENPSINIGNNGLAARDLLFNPSKTIGFDAGFHVLDRYLLRQDSIHYYRAKSPYTELYYVNGGKPEQIFKVTHTQNIRPNWNFGANYFRNGSDGLFKNQKADHTNIALFTWYESRNKRYNILAHALFNTLKAGENGSVIKDTIYTASETLRRDAEIVRLSGSGANRPQQSWKQRGLSLKQSYFIGRIDSLHEGDTKTIAATQSVSYEINYLTDQYKFYRNEADIYNALPHPANDNLLLTNDSTIVKNLQNEFMYSFSLRGRSAGFLKNELKLDLGARNNIYSYEQMGYNINFQNTTLKAGISYRFSDRINITGNLQQIALGRNIGDFLYEAKTNFLLSQSVGRIILGVYQQNKSPEQVFERSNYQYHSWGLSFDRTKISNLSFAYENPKYRFFTKAEYYLVTDYLYFAETAVSKQITSRQAGNSINLLKLSLRKDFKIWKLNLENYLVYQKSDSRGLLRTPEFYMYNSVYFANRFFKVLYTNFGFDVRFNSSFPAQSYSLNMSQFYNGPGIEYSSYPIADVWIKATLKRTNLFVKYDYANQGLFSKGYYTVRRYPMPDANLKFGVSWKFYN